VAHDETVKPSWGDPVAAFLAIAGIGAGAAVITGRRRLTLRAS
jgi:hypothetical protein